MFDSLSEKFEKAFYPLRNKGKLSQEDIDQTVSEIREALLEADVNYKVCQDFCTSVREKAAKMKLIKSLSPGHMIVKFVQEALIEAMGRAAPLDLAEAPPVVIMLVGLQGSGKTTSCGKLAKYIKEDLKRKPAMVSTDVYRPAAIKQLDTLGRQLGVEVIDFSHLENPVVIAQQALKSAENSGCDSLIVDTAGRLQIDDELMNELVDIVEAIEPREILLVADAMTGQEAVNIAEAFDHSLDIDGVVLTKLDGDARGGAALSIRAVTGKPIKFIGVGEKLDALEVFHPDRLASRILGMGDVISLVEKVSKQVDEKQAKKLRKKIKKNEFSLEDFHSQLKTIKSMGSMSSLMNMVPGLGKMAGALDDDEADRELKRVEAIILSMTPQERRNHNVLNGSRRKRIASGSGTSVEDVNKLVRQFVGMRKVMKKLTKGGKAGLRGLGGLSSMMTRGGGTINFGRR